MGNSDINVNKTIDSILVKNGRLGKYYLDIIRGSYLGKQVNRLIDN